ncbi:MAG: signal peptidase I [Gammaproteobacteria bacterium]|nr:signal peptidase I [Gammaproteobacteria bacterium]
MRFDFATLLVLLVLVCGIIWAIDAALWAPRRRRDAAERADAERGDAERDRAAGSDEYDVEMPKIVELARSFFPVFLVVLLLRSFLVEPFRIPSGSMVPTLLIGDFILVNKFTYGIRLPITDHKIIEIGTPQRGDIVVFRYPEDPAVPYIKRVVGLPGDRINYEKKRVHINGKPVPLDQVPSLYSGRGSQSRFTGFIHQRETLGEKEHSILLNPRRARAFPIEYKVPEDHYFVLGDNRDESADSRVWGFVPDQNLIGKAFKIWMHFDWGHGGPQWERLGSDIE